MSAIHIPHDAGANPPVSQQNGNAARPFTIRPSKDLEDGVSFLWKPGEILADLIYSDSLRFVIRDSKEIRESDTVNFSGKDYPPPSWLADFARPDARGMSAFRLPSKAAPYGSIDELAEDIRSFIHTYFDCSEEFQRLATLYVLHTWLIDRFYSVPYLRFIGAPTTGKSRATTTIGSLCYRPLVLTGNITEAALFRTLDVTGGTLLLDEADFEKSQLGSTIAKIFNSGYQRGQNIVRMDKDEKGKFVPSLFDPFGPKILNGRTPIKDAATETRCFAYTPIKSARASLESQIRTEFWSRALEIRNQCLKWRLDTLDGLTTHSIQIPGCEGRSSELAMPLWAVGRLLKDQRPWLKALLYAVNEKEARASSTSQNTWEYFIADSLINWSGAGPMTCKALVSTIKERHGDTDPDLMVKLTPRKLSGLLADLGVRTRKTNVGALVVLEPDRRESLKRVYGLCEVDEAA